MTGNQNVCSVILAAGKGTRMKSEIPKVFHEILGKSLLQHVCDRLEKTGINNHCVIASGPSDYFKRFHEENPSRAICFQKETRGTGDAVASASVLFSNVKKPSYTNAELWKGNQIAPDYLLICTGDAPAIPSEDLSNFISLMQQSKADLGVIGMKVPDPTGYGRLIKNNKGFLEKIVEQKDASEEEMAIDICNSGVIFAKTSTLFELLGKLTTENSQKEYYLTDCFKLAKNLGLNTFIYETKNWECYQGINTPDQLNALSEFMKS